MARNENFRKHSTTLFHHRKVTRGNWSGILTDHKNLMNHQIYVTLSTAVSSGTIEIRIIPDTESTVAKSIATGFIIDFDKGASDLVGPGLFLPYRDSGFHNFTGVIKGIEVRFIDPFVTYTYPTLDPDPPPITMSIVLTSFSRMRERGQNEERYDYVSSTIIEEKPSDGLISFSLPTPNHLNMAYHQLMMVSDTPVATGQAEYEVRVIPDSDVELETSVYIGQDMFFPTAWFGVDNAPLYGDEQTYIIWFGGIFRGIHLRAVRDIPPASGHKFTAVLSSSIEQFNQVFYSIVGGAGNPPDLSTHLTDYDNPHQTSWDNLLNKPLTTTGYTLTKEVLDAGVELTIPVEHQYIVWKSFDIEGSLTVEGTLVVLGDRPDSPELSPDLTYNGAGKLTQVDYDTGGQKLLTYNGSGQLIQVDEIVDGVTFRKELTYAGTQLDYITESYP